ncbi:DHH family protein [compost metagenome]
MKHYTPSGLQQFLNILGRSSKYIIYYDPDIDGLFSGFLIDRVLTHFKKQFSYIINKDREHGLKLTLEQIKKLKGFTLIMVDAFISEEEMKLLVDNGVNVINIDHHDTKENTLLHIKTDQAEGVKINNQYSFEPEEFRFLSGAGVIYYVIESIWPGLFKEDEKVMVGISLLSDVRPIENEVARKFLHTVYTSKSEFSKYLISVTRDTVDFGFGEIVLDRNFIDYTLSPKLNALFRLNYNDFAVELVHGVKGLQNELSLFRTIQKDIQNSIIDNLKYYPDSSNLSSLICGYVDKDLPLIHNANITNFIGLACSKVKNRGKTSILFVKDNEKILRGSLRGLADNVDYLELCRSFGITCQGHKNAFGIQDIDKAVFNIKALNDVIKQEEMLYLKSKYKGRLLRINNLAFFLKSTNICIADTNNYVRDAFRFYVKYEGDLSNVRKIVKGKRIEYIIDGIPVLCFDENIRLDRALILPLKERGKYIQFYLQEY